MQNGKIYASTNAIALSTIKINLRLPTSQLYSFLGSRTVAPLLHSCRLIDLQSPLTKISTHEHSDLSLHSAMDLNSNFFFIQRNFSRETVSN